MALSATDIWEVQTGGADGNGGNGGGFNPGSANFPTDGVISSATGASPVLSSVSYNWLAGDVGHWAFLSSGTNLNAGWYPIASVASNQATLTASIGSGVLSGLSSNPNIVGPTTVLGCGTSASLSSITWGMDYSQTGAAGISYTDMVIAATTTNYTSAGHPVGPNVIGNIIAVSAGTGFTVQRVEIISVAGTTATCDKTLGTAASTGGTGILGGALASPGQASALAVSGNDLCVKSGTYTITSATASIAGGCVSWAGGSSISSMCRILGYGSVRGDMGTRPVLQAGTITTFTLFTAGVFNYIANLVFDGQSKASSSGLSAGATSDAVYFCTAKNCTATAFNSQNSTAFCILCEVSGSSNIAYHTVGSVIACTAHDNTCKAFLLGTTPNLFVDCIACNNSGANSDGWNGGQGTFINCTAYNNGSNGFNPTASQTGSRFVNCLAVNNAGYGYTATAAYANCQMFNCAGYNNTSGLVNNTNIQTYDQIGLVTLTANPFNNAAGNDFSLNNSAGGGALCRAAGIPGATSSTQLPGLSTLSYLDIGAAQVQRNVVVVQKNTNIWITADELGFDF